MGHLRSLPLVQCPDGIRMGVAWPTEEPPGAFVAVMRANPVSAVVRRPHDRDPNGHYIGALYDYDDLAFDDPYQRGQRSFPGLSAGEPLEIGWKEKAPGPSPTGGPRRRGAPFEVVNISSFNRIETFVIETLVNEDADHSMPGDEHIAGDRRTATAEPPGKSAEHPRYPPAKQQTCVAGRPDAVDEHEATTKGRKWLDDARRSLFADRRPRPAFTYGGGGLFEQFLRPQIQEQPRQPVFALRVPVWWYSEGEERPIRIMAEVHIHDDPSRFLVAEVKGSLQYKGMLRRIDGLIDDALASPDTYRILHDPGDNTELWGQQAGTVPRSGA